MSKTGWQSKGQARKIEILTTRSNLVTRVGRMQTAPVTNLQAKSNTKTKGAQVTFEVLSLQGIEMFVLLRNFSRDPGSAIVLHSWPRLSLLTTPEVFPLRVTYGDSDQALAGQKVFYWVKVVPASNRTQSNSLLVGPQQLDASADPGAPNPMADLSVSRQAASGGFVTIGVSVKPPVGDNRWGSTILLVAGYNGVAANVALVQSEGTTFQVVMKQTGETVTFTAIAVSTTGQQALTGPTTVFTLAAGQSVPAKVMNAFGLELQQTGVQLSWPNGPEPVLIRFHIFRGPKNGGFGASAQIATLVWSATTAIFNFLDTTGLLGCFEWYITAENSSGQSGGSDAIQTNALNSTADITPNNANSSLIGASPLTSTTGGAPNQATITIAACQMQFPFGVVNYNSGAITPLNDATTYWVYADDINYQGGAVIYHASTTPPPVTASEGRIWFGQITTPVFGGGGTGGSHCFTGLTLVITKDGIKPISAIVGGLDEVLTQRGWRKVRRVLRHEHDGPMLDMGGDFVTPEHRFWWKHFWQPAKAIFPFLLTRFRGSVFNLDVEGDGSDEEQCYTLANGWIAHNMKSLP